MATTYTIKALNETTWDAFAALVEANNGVFGGCWCMGFHPEGCDRETAGVNRRRKLERVQEGTTHAALVFDGDAVPRLVPVRSTRRAPADQEPRRLSEGRGDPSGRGWRAIACWR